MLKIKKKQVVMAVLAGLASVAAVADTSGPYVGIQAGYGNVHQAPVPNENFADTVSYTQHFSDKGLAGRIFAGYQFNPNVALETGFTRFHDSHDNITATYAGIPLSEKATLKTQAWDVVGKGILPLQNGFSLYGKAGVAYLMADAKARTTLGSVNASASKSANHIYPTASVGVSYDITKNVVADVSYTRIQKTGGSKKLSSTDFAAVGLAYNFG